MKTNKRKMPKEESAYAMLVRSEEKNRGYVETTLYALIVLAAVAAIMQFNLQPDPLPLTTLPSIIPPA